MLVVEPDLRRHRTAYYFPSVRQQSKISYRNQLNEPDPIPSKATLSFSVSSKCLSTSSSLAEVTTAFFVDNFRQGYTLETKNPAWNQMDLQVRKKIRNQYSDREPFDWYYSPRIRFHHSLELVQINPSTGLNPYKITSPVSLSNLILSIFSIVLIVLIAPLLNNPQIACQNAL